MDSRNGNAALTAAAAASPLLQRPPALLSLPELDRPPAIMDMWELEAIAAALPAKKRRLRETFDRLAACSPAPLPFAWHDLDNYISSLQYSVTLRHRQLRGLDSSRPAPALPPAPAPAVSAAAAADGARQMRDLEESQSVPALLAVSEPGTTGGEVHTLGAVVKSEPVHDDPPQSPAAVSAPAAATCVNDDENGKKRKASSEEKETEAINAAAARVQQEAQAEMRKRRLQEKRKRRRVARVLEAQAVTRKLREDEEAAAAEKAAASPSQLQDMNCNGSKKLRPASPLPQDTSCNGNKSRPFPPGPAGNDNNSGLAVAEANSRTDAAAQVAASVSEIAAVLQEPPGSPTARLASTATNRARTSKVTGVRHESSAASPPKATSLSVADKVPKQEPDVAAMEIVEAEQRRKQELPDDEVPDVEMEIVEPEEMQDAPGEKAPPLQTNAREVGAPKSAAAVHAATRDASDDSPHGGNGLAKSGVSIDDAIQTAAAACSSAFARRDSPAAAARRGVNATDLVPATGREATGPSQDRAPPKPSQARAPPKASNKQHMPQQGYHGRTSSSPQNQSHSFSRNNHGGRPTGSRPVPEAQDAAAAAQWSRPGEWRGGPRHGDVSTSNNPHHGDVSTSNKGNAKGKAPIFCTKCGFKGHLAENCRTAKHHMFCNKCGCKGHLAETCRTAKHLVDLYQKAMANQICYRCGCTGHWSRKCRTPKHLVDLYQKDRAAKLAAQGNVLP